MQVDFDNDSQKDDEYIPNYFPTANFEFTPNKPVSGQNVAFDASLSYDPDGAIISYEWDFGDKNTSNLQNPTHRYTNSGTYTVTLTVTDDQGVSDSTSRTIIVSPGNIQPVANFTYNPPNPTTADNIQFTSTSYDPDGKIISWTWDFSDGATSTEQNPTHRYNNPGVYNVTLTVTDDDGVTDRISKLIIVTESPASQPTILLLVNKTIYPQIQNNLSIFRQDLYNEGYQVPVIQIPSSYNTPPIIKNVIRSYYNQTKLLGAILIGNITAAYTELKTGDYSNPDALRIWISLDACDMYYMDLDGKWEHVTDPDFCEDAPPNVIECHTYPSCETFKDEYIVTLSEEKEWNYWEIENKTQYKAEIWVARIMGHNLDIPRKNEADIINGYFEWDHKYRIGDYTFSDTVYLYDAINDPIIDHGMDFSNIFTNIIRKPHATKDEYVTCLEDPQGSKLIYLLAHSGPQGHMLFDEFLNTDELMNLNRSSVFYILNACSSCRWDQYISSPSNPNYLGGLYVFDKREDKRNYGLGAIGFTGVGGFNWLVYLTDYLNNHSNSNYGEAYKYWFNQNLMRIFGPTNFVFLGDPTIRPHPFDISSIPSIVYVDDDYNPSTPGWKYNHFNKIEDAINAVTEDGTIYVSSGIYHENLVIAKTLNLVGENKENTIIDGGENGVVVNISADNVTLSNLTIKNSTKDWGYSGVHVYHASKVIIKDCVISNNFVGIHLSNVKNSSIADNMIYSNYAGLTLIYNSTSNSISNNLIGYNEYGGGIDLCGFCCNNLVEHNQIEHNLGYGIGLSWNSNNNRFIENQVCNNSGSGIVSAWVGLIGKNSTAHHNEITGNTICSNKEYGIYLYGSNGNTVVNNHVFNNTQCGIKLENCSNSLIYNNYFNNVNNSWDNSLNAWGISKTVGINIIGGPHLGGNYWSDYQQKYPDSKQTDGIWNTPYNIPGGASLDIYPLADIISPPKVTGLTVKDAKDGKLNLAWNPATDNVAVDHYNIYRDGDLLTSVKTTSYQDTGLTNGKTYTYEVSAVDTCGNEGDKSDPATGTPTASTTGGGETTGGGGSRYGPTNTPPNTPTTPQGTTAGFINTNYTYTTTTNDPQGDQIYYKFDWGDGTYSGWLGPYESGITINASHSWNTPGVYSIKVKAKDTSNLESGWSNTLQVTITPGANYPPNTPTKPKGPKTGDTNVTYNFTTTTTDPDNNTIKYQIDWDDNTTTTTELVPSGETITVSHNWTKEGTYNIRIKAIDQYLAESNWSQPHVFIIDKTKPTIKIINPQNNTVVKDEINVTVNASDPHLTKVVFELIKDNKTITKHVSTDAPYHWILDATKQKEGKYTLKATAYDIANNTQTTTITISITHEKQTPGFQTPLLIIALLATALLTLLHRKKKQP
ncbi:MAG TPA: PKD domain-containing protein [Thermoplasmatales archaeon]|nr:PKD domain-containing protein [Thermoplasmatales archaeon]